MNGFRPFMFLKGEASSSCFWRFITGVNNTGDKFTTGVVDTGDKFNTGVNHTGDKFVAGVNNKGKSPCMIYHRCQQYLL